MAKKLLIPILFFSFFMLFAPPGRAQDTHYWTPKYGAQSTLLNGAVVGSHLDISSSFYNPGALGISKNPAFILSGWIYNLEQISFDNFAGAPVYDLQFTPAPDFLTGLIPLKSERNRLAYSYLTRQKLDLRLTGRESYTEETSLDRANDALYAVEHFLDQDLNETWIGLTWAHKINEKLGLGITNYMVYRSQELRRQGIIQQLYDLQASTAILVKHFRYYNYRLLWKIGLAADFSPLKLGVTVTTPSINLFGLGRTYVNHVNTGSYTADDGKDIIEFDEQSDLSTYYRSPISIAFGCSYKFKNTTLHLSMEWYDSVGPFSIMQTAPFHSQTTGEELQNRVIQELGSVFNFGFGAQEIISEKFELYASFATDFSAFKPNSEANVSVSSWDIYHLMMGALFRLWRSEITAGVGYSFGSQVAGYPLGFQSTGNKDFSCEQFKQQAHYSNLTFLVGFSIFPVELFTETLKGLRIIEK